MYTMTTMLHLHDYVNTNRNATLALWNWRLGHQNRDLDFLCTSISTPFISISVMMNLSEKDPWKYSESRWMKLLLLIDSLLLKVTFQFFERVFSRGFDGFWVNPPRIDYNGTNFRQAWFQLSPLLGQDSDSHWVSTPSPLKWMITPLNPTVHCKLT